MDGKAYIASLQDGRSVYARGEKVGDLMSHPDFAPNIARTAEVYDRFEADPAAREAFFTPPTAAPAAPDAALAAPLAALPGIFRG